MLTKEVQLSKFEVNTNTKTLSIRLDTVIKENDIVISRAPDRRAFVPGDIAGVKEYIGSADCPEVVYLESIWTDEVIAEYKESIAPKDV